MKCLSLFATAGLALFVVAPGLHAETKVVFEHNGNDQANGEFRFKTVPPPSKSDAATNAKFSLPVGEADGNGGGLENLHDGKLPTEADEPEENFFFNAGTPGGRILIDLGTVTEVKQVNSYSWHPGTRGPQVYKLYASDGTAEGFQVRPSRGTDPEKTGWKFVAQVDTRPKEGEAGGQYGVSICDSEGALGKYRYLLLDVSATETEDAFGNTFFSEIDVVDSAATTTPANASSERANEPFLIHSADGYCAISIDTSGAPDLRDWAEKRLAPVLAEWYPKITTLLTSDGYSAPTNFSVIIRPGSGVAATSRARITANSNWLKRELQREAIGALVHEEIHVAQQYRGGRRSDSDYKRPPGWLVEGIPDYIRWFLYEPQSHGADASYFRARRNLNLKYDGLYRVSANFLNYAVETYDKDKTLITKVNAACRQGKYSDELWKELTGKTLADLNEEWKTALQKQMAEAKTLNQIATVEGADPNTLTEAEKAAGWKLLFNGKDFTGWHNFKREGVRPGWEVKDGALVCADPHNAGDIVTAEQYDWFELQLDYNISPAGNSGIMYHVTDQGGAVWATGPEFQLEDNQAAADPVRCGWLYALYQPPDDPQTAKPLDATKPAGQWNHVRLLISPEKCVHEINVVQYFEYVLGSEDFLNRVAKSKFSRMSGFAKSNIGRIALQGDHGSISFRNIKIRPIAP
jgi:Domain of Unknown Function (DUF1080)/Peptidase of plants and bacteria